MTSSLARSALAHFVVGFALLASASAQSFNVDIGANGTFPVPNNTHAGSNGVAGTWNAVSGTLVGTQALLDLNGAATAVTIAQSGGTANLDSNNANTTGPEEALLDDAQVIAAAGITTWTINGLANGPYRVTVYAWAPDNPVGVVAQVRVVGGAIGPRNCGGAAFTAYEYDTTHIADSTVVTAGTLSIELSNVSGIGRCNGIQIETLPANFGAVLRGPFDLTSITGRGDHVALGALDNDYFVKGTGTGGINELLYRIDATSLVATTVSGTLPCALARDVAQRPTVGAATRVIYTTIGTQTCRYEYVGDTLTSCTPAFAAPGALGITEFVPINVPPLVGEHLIYDDGTGQLLARDTATFGGPTQISAGTGFVWQGLAWDFVNEMLWGFASFNAAGGSTDLLLCAEVDPRNGRLTGKAFQGQAGLGTSNVAGGCEIHVDSTNPAVLSLATIHVNTTSSDQLVVYDIGTAYSSGVTYCTPAISSNGCSALMSASGVPTVTAPSGYTLNANGVEGLKLGLIFYGISGQVALPWGGGFLCVKAPVQRTPAQNSGGTNGACNGVLSLDWLAYVNTHPGSLGAPHAAGTIVDTQAWYRDPPSPKTSNMSDALEFILFP